MDKEKVNKINRERGTKIHRLMLERVIYIYIYIYI